MKRILFVILVLLCVAVPERALFAQETNSEAINALNDLITRINQKISMRQTNETDLGVLIKEFDTLMEKFKDAPEKDRVQILTMKAQLYLEVLNQPEKALEVFRQFKRDMPGVQIGGNTDEVIRMLEKRISAKQIQRTLVVGATFPAFEETDLNGKPLSLSKYRGKIVLVDFWATWCVPCLIEMPNVIRTYEQFHSKGFEVIGISLDQDRAKLESFIKEKHLDWPQYCDGKFWDTRPVLTYGIESIPASFLLDRNGKILGVNLRGEDLEKAVAMETMPGFQKMLAVGSRNTEDLIRRTPYSSVAATFVAGLVAGMLIARRRFRKQAELKA